MSFVSLLTQWGREGEWLNRRFSRSPAGAHRKIERNGALSKGELCDRPITPAGFDSPARAA